MQNTTNMRPSQESGFTLLETLVALTILAIALTSLLQSHAGASRVSGTTQDYAFARIVGEKVMAETLGAWNGGPHKSSGQDGTFTWEATIQPEKAPWAALSSEQKWMLYRVAVTVGWPGGRKVALETLKLGERKNDALPNPAHSTARDAGFTLVELVVSLTILAVILGLLGGGCARCRKAPIATTNASRCWI